MPTKQYRAGESWLVRRQGPMLLSGNLPPSVIWRVARPRSRIGVADRSTKKVANVDDRRRTFTGTVFPDRSPHSFSVGKNLGGLRPCTVCSNPYAIFSNVGSLQARPKNEIPTGKPNTNPAGTVISG